MKKSTKPRISIDFDAPALLADLERCGWSAEKYSALNSDLSQLSAAQLARHFLQYGLPEGRKFSARSDRAPQFQVERVSTAEGQIIMHGWCEEEVAAATGILVFTDENTIKYEVVQFAALRYWRDDVARHFGVPLRDTRHGTLLSGTTKELSLEGAKLYIFAFGAAFPYTARPEKRESARQCYLEVFRLLESINVHSELVYLLADAPDFVSMMSKVHQESMARVESRISYSQVRGEPLYAICAVVIGNASLFKTWLMALPDHHDLSGCEVNVLCNGPNEYEHILRVARWFAEVLGGSIKVHFSPENLGFNVAVNRLLDSLTTEYAMVTNIDVSYLGFDLDRLIALTADSRAICAARQFNPMGALQHTGLEIQVRDEMVHGRSFKVAESRLVGRNTIPRQTEPQDIEVEFFGAACFFGTRALLRKLGPFSPGFLYAYHEDSDLASRARREGVKLIVTSALDLVHYESSGVRIDVPKRFFIAANCVLLLRELLRPASSPVIAPIATVRERSKASPKGLPQPLRTKKGVRAAA